MDITRKLNGHVKKMRQTRLCPGMYPPVVSGGAVVSKVVLVGQAPGDKEPKLGRPFAWTAGKTLFRWFNEAAAHMPKRVLGIGAGRIVSKATRRKQRAAKLGKKLTQAHRKAISETIKARWAESN